MNHLIRKSAPLASTAWKQTLLPALTALEAFPVLPSTASAAHPCDFTGEIPTEKLGFFGLGRRGFHFSTKPLEFRSSLAAQAQFAMDDFSDEEKVSGKKGGSDCEEGLEISKLGIDQDIVSALRNRGISKLFPIQSAVLEPAMQGRDMIGRARTGTGKTLAFGIPIMDKIYQFNAKHGAGRAPLALVMAPTRELAKQVEKEFAESAPKLATLCVYGGTPIGRQMGELDRGVDVVVGTPGRLIDLLKRGALDLSAVQFIVLDEADQMLAVGFEEDVEIILSKLPSNRQSMMFSATMPPWIRQLTQKYLKNPLTVDLVGDSHQKLADGITLYSIASDMYGRASILGPLITEHAKGGKCIVFTQTKRDADRLSYAMQRSFKCEALHGDITQNQRERTLSDFRDGRFNVLVATDVAARGLDVPNVDLVIHYEPPNSSEIFVHRSGRTGRAGKKGSAILIYSDQQLRQIQGIERDVGCKFTELPRIAATGGNQDMMDIGGGGRLGSFGSRGGRSDSGYGRSGGFGRSGGYSGRTGGYGESGSGRFNSFGSGSSSGRGGFGGSSFGRSGGFADSGSSRSGGFGFGDSNGSGRSSGFKDSNSARPSGGFGNSGSNRYAGSGSGIFGDYGDDKSGRSF